MTTDIVTPLISDVRSQAGELDLESQGLPGAVSITTETNGITMSTETTETTHDERTVTIRPTSPTNDRRPRRHTL